MSGGASATALQGCCPDCTNSTLVIAEVDMTSQGGPSVGTIFCTTRGCGRVLPTSVYIRECATLDALWLSQSTPQEPISQGEVTKRYRAFRTIEYAADSLEDLRQQLHDSYADGLHRPGVVEFRIRTHVTETT